jgi:hypothetical protein
MLTHAVMYGDIKRTTIRKVLTKLERKFGKPKVAELRSMVL